MDSTANLKQNALSNNKASHYLTPFRVGKFFQRSNKKKRKVFLSRIQKSSNDHISLSKSEKRGFIKNITKKKFQKNSNLKLILSQKPKIFISSSPAPEPRTTIGDSRKNSNLRLPSKLSFRQSFSNNNKNSERNFQLTSCGGFSQLVNEFCINSSQNKFDNTIAESFVSDCSSETSIKSLITPKIRRNKVVRRKKRLTQIILKQQNNFFDLNPTRGNYKKKPRSSRFFLNLEDYCDHQDRKSSRECTKNSGRSSLIPGNSSKKLEPESLLQFSRIEQLNRKSIESGKFKRRRSMERKNLHFADSKKVFRILTRNRSRPLTRKKSFFLEIERVRLRKSSFVCFKN